MKALCSSIVLITLLVTTGCTAGDAESPSTGANYGVLDQPQSEADVIPVLMHPDDASFQPDTLRRVGELDHLGFYVAVEKGGELPCLVAFTPSDSLLADCGESPTLTAPAEWGKSTVRLVPDGYAVPDGWEPFAPNVIFQAR